MVEDVDQTAGDAELRDLIQDVKRRRRDRLSLLYMRHGGQILALPEQIGLLDWVVWLDLEGTRVSDLTPIAPLVRLETLDLRGLPVTDLSPLAGMTRLRALFLEGSQIGDMEPLAGLDRLEDLWISHSNVSDLSPLAYCRGLKRLALRGTSVADLTPLSGLPALADLDITGTQITDLTPLLRLPAFCDTDGDSEPGISFEDIPATVADKALARIAREEDNPARRAEDLVDHLTGGARLAGWRGDA